VPETGWGKAFETIAVVAGLPLAVGRGAVSAATGKDFQEGFDRTADALDGIVSSAGNFGDRHAAGLTQTARDLGEVAAITVRVMLPGVLKKPSS
jgi:hypothetical protein